MRKLYTVRRKERRRSQDAVVHKSPRADVGTRQLHTKLHNRIRRQCIQHNGAEDWSARLGVIPKGSDGTK